MTAFYNEIDPYAAQWLRNLIDAGHIAPGVVDERSIEDILPDELRDYTQCHFFAGIGVWSYALRRAGWPDDRPVWTGSCPCQPFSAAGKGNGFADERHLWPAFNHLIEHCRPPVVFGEQVASKDADAWIDLVHADVESMGYAFGAVPFPSAGVGAPHIRDRLYWVAHAAGNGRERRGAGKAGNGGHAARIESQRLCDAGGLGDADHEGLEGHWSRHQTEGGRVGALRPVAEAGEFGGMADAMRAGSLPGALARVHRSEEGAGARNGESQRSGAARRLADSSGERRQQDPGSASSYETTHGSTGRNECQPNGDNVTSSYGANDSPGPTNGFWRDADWLFCRDGKWRPVEPGAFPLAHGAPARVGRLRAYGNAINAEAARVFITAFGEALRLQDMLS
ncbi:MAG: DNA cytosine methyltransferase [Pseudomonadota bacterium]